MTDSIVYDGCEVGSKHLAALEVLEGLGPNSLFVFLAREDLHKGLERGGLEYGHRVERCDGETGLSEGLGYNLICMSLLILEDVPLDNFKGVEKLRVFVDPEIFELFLGDALLALDAANDTNTVGAERHYRSSKKKKEEKNSGRSEESLLKKQ